MPNKLCLFLWRACRDILHCYAALKKKSILLRKGDVFYVGKKVRLSYMLCGVVGRLSLRESILDFGFSCQVLNLQFLMTSYIGV